MDISKASIPADFSGSISELYDFIIAFRIAKTADEGSAVVLDKMKAGITDPDKLKKIDACFVMLKDFGLADEKGVCKPSEFIEKADEAKLKAKENQINAEKENEEKQEAYTAARKELSGARRGLFWSRVRKWGAVVLGVAAVVLAAFMAPALAGAIAGVIGGAASIGATVGSAIAVGAGLAGIYQVSKWFVTDNFKKGAEAVEGYMKKIAAAKEKVKEAEGPAVKASKELAKQNQISKNFESFAEHAIVDDATREKAKEYATTGAEAGVTDESGLAAWDSAKAAYEKRCAEAETQAEIDAAKRAYESAIDNIPTENDKKAINDLAAEDFVKGDYYLAEGNYYDRIVERRKEAISSLSEDSYKNFSRAALKQIPSSEEFEEQLGAVPTKDAFESDSVKYMFANQSAYDEFVSTYLSKEGRTVVKDESQVTVAAKKFFEGAHQTTAADVLEILQDQMPENRTALKQFSDKNFLLEDVKVYKGKRPRDGIVAVDALDFSERAKNSIFQIEAELRATYKIEGPELEAILATSVENAAKAGTEYETVLKEATKQLDDKHAEKTDSEKWSKFVEKAKFSDDDKKALSELQSGSSDEIKSYALNLIKTRFYLGDTKIEQYVSQVLAEVPKAELAKEAGNAFGQYVLDISKENEKNQKRELYEQAFQRANDDLRNDDRRRLIIKSDDIHEAIKKSNAHKKVEDVATEIDSKITASFNDRQRLASKVEVKKGDIHKAIKKSNAHQRAEEGTEKLKKKAEKIYEQVNADPKIQREQLVRRLNVKPTKKVEEEEKEMPQEQKPGDIKKVRDEYIAKYNTELEYDKLMKAIEKLSKDYDKLLKEVINNDDLDQVSNEASLGAEKLASSVKVFSDIYNNWAQTVNALCIKYKQEQEEELLMLLENSATLQDEIKKLRELAKTLFDDVKDGKKHVKALSERIDEYDNKRQIVVPFEKGDE